MAERIEMPWGYVEFGGPTGLNEVNIVSTVEDPPSINLASQAGISLGTVRFGRVRPDGIVDTFVLIQGKQDERTRHDPTNRTGEFTVHLRRDDPDLTDDQQWVRVMEVRHDSVWIKGISP